MDGTTTRQSAQDERTVLGDSGTPAARIRVDHGARTSDKVWRRRTALLIAGLLLFRLAYAWIVPLDLVHDEAYYWDWSRQLDWGYYSKPPMVAWLIAAGTSMAGSTAFAVRLPAVLLGTCSLVWLYLLGTALYGRRAGFWAVCLAAATPGNVALGLLMTIDAPLLFCWSASLYLFWRLIQADCRRAGWLLAAVLVTGLGLLSKQTMFGFLILAGLFLLTSREDRRELARPAFWLWAVGALLFLLPVVWWNIQHGWITAQHTSEHFSGEPVGLLKRLIRCTEFVVSQFGLLSPVTGFLALSVLAAALMSFLHLRRRERYLVCFSGVPLAGVLVLSLLQRVEPNWPAAFYPAAILLLVGLASNQVELRVWPRLPADALRRAVVVGAISAAITYAVPFGFGLQGTRLDPAVRLRGWAVLGQEVAERFSRLPRPASSFIVVTAGRAVASEVAFYTPGQPQVYLWNSSDKVVSQYDLWNGPRDKQDWDALIITDARAAPPANLKAAFARVENHGTLYVPIGAGRALHYQLWRGVNLHRWPDRRTSVAQSFTTAQYR